MINVKKFKKGDWVSFSIITDNGNDNYEIKECNNNFCLYFKTDKNCVYGKSNVYSEKKYCYWFDITEDELINCKSITREQFVEMFKNYDIEIHKYKTICDNSWLDYERTKKDYNYKYDIVKGINKGWALNKKKMLGEYIEDLADARKTKDCNFIKFNEQALECLIDGLTQQINISSQFTIGGSAFAGLQTPTTVEYFYTMLMNYCRLSMKYKRLLDSDLYYIILDFEELIRHAKMYYLSQVDIEIATFVMNGTYDIQKITTEINDIFKLKTPLKEEDINNSIANLIPLALIKAELDMSK